MHKQAALMYKLFKGRRDTWAVRRNDGNFFRVMGKEMTVEDYSSHLEGKDVIGIYPLLQSGEFCAVACIDIDSNELELANKLCQLIPNPNHLERSRSGNYHIWMFFREPASIDRLAQVCKEAIQYARSKGDHHCNLYPLPAKGFGLLIALPLQGLLVPKGLTVFVDDTGKVIEDQFGYLREIKFTKAPGSIMDDRVLQQLWLGEGKKTGDRTSSGYDFSFCRALFQRNFTRDQVKRLLRKRPGLHSSEDAYIEKTLDAAAVKAPTTPEQDKIADWGSIEPIGREEFFDRLSQKLVLQAEQKHHLEMFFGVIIANLKTRGRPVWMLIVGPPGCGKTLPMMAIRNSPVVYSASAFKPSALISGWGMKGGSDMSLMPKLNGKILLVKDLSSLLSQHKEVVAEVLGLMRDAYDGACSRPFGTGTERSYTNLRFGFIGATTPDIDAHWSLNVRLGERFLRYRLHSKDLDQVYAKIDSSLNTLMDEDKVDTAVEDACLAFLKHLIEDERPMPALTQTKQIGRLAQLGAILRTAVSRGPYEQHVLVIPEWEEATRYAKQLAKTALGLAYVRGKKETGDEEIKDLKQLVRDAMDARIERICHIIYNKAGLDTGEIAAIVNLPVWTVRSCLDNLAVARIMYHERNSFRLTWHFTPWIRGQLNHFKLWPAGAG